MALPPAENSAILREVDEAVRADVARDVAQRHGRTIVAVALAGLLAFGGWMLWDHRQETRAAEQGAAFNAALDKAPGGRAALDKAMAPIARDGTPAYRALARMTQGSAAAGAGDQAAAARTFAAIAGDTALPDDLRSVALLRQTIADFDTTPPDAIIARLAPMVAAEGPGWATAAELTAIAELKRGKRDAAAALFRRIAASPQASEALKTRANQMASSLAATAVPGAPAATAARPATPAPSTSTPSTPAASPATTSSRTK